VAGFRGRGGYSGLSVDREAEEGDNDGGGFKLYLGGLCVMWTHEPFVEATNFLWQRLGAEAVAWGSFWFSGSS